MSVLLFILIVFVLVMVHEYGHFLAARIFGVRVEEFAFGFPPRIVSKKKGDTLYSLNAIPVGGYVKLFGEDQEQILSEEEKSVSLTGKSRWKQALILLAGVVFNALFAWVLLSAAFMIGVPSSDENVTLSDTALTVTSVMTGTPAYKAGIQAGDKFISVSLLNEVRDIQSVDVFQSAVKDAGATPITVTYSRGNEIQTTEVTPEILSEGKDPMIGISLGMVGTAKLSVWNSITHGLSAMWNLLVTTLMQFVDLISRAFNGTGNLSDLSGPVGIVHAVGDASHFGLGYVLFFAALISVNLAILNLLPFPALDGGRLVILGIEAIIQKSLNQKVVGWIHFGGFSLLILFMILVTYHDIVRMF